MIISDKQELRRCVKQLVRRADVCEASLSFDFEHGESGVEAMLDLWARPAATPGESLARSTAEQTPFSPDAAAMFAALDAMDMSVRDLDRAKAQQEEYDRGAYIRELLDTMRARCVLVRVPLERAESMSMPDERLAPVLAVPGSLFAPGRYGVDYAGAAREIAAAAQALGTGHVALNGFDLQALRFCLLPLCEDHGFVLHMHLAQAQEAEQFALLMDAFEDVRALAFADAPAQSALISAAHGRPRLLVCLTDPGALGEALSVLGTRFAAYSAQAALPEQMLGRWALVREEIWQSFAAAYLPLARAGYPLETAAIERDVRRVMSGNLLALMGRAI